MRGAGCTYVFFYTACVAEQHGIGIADASDYVRVVFGKVGKQHYFFGILIEFLRGRRNEADRLNGDELFKHAGSLLKDDRRYGVLQPLNANLFFHGLLVSKW